MTPKVFVRRARIKSNKKITFFQFLCDQWLSREKCAFLPRSRQYFFCFTTELHHRVRLAFLRIAVIRFVLPPPQNVSPQRGIPRLTVSANLPENWNLRITSSSFLLLALKITATEPKTETWNVRYADSPSTCADNPNWTLTFSKPTSSTKSLQPSTNHAYESSPYTMPTRSNEMPTLKPWKRSKKPSDTEWSSKSAWSIRHL